jgi:pseudoazurin
MHRRNFLTVLLAGTAFAAAAAGSGSALAGAPVVVKLRNSGPDGAMVFDPGFVKTTPGASIHFVSTDLGHNVELIPAMAPAGVSLPKGAMGKDLTVTLPKPGLYGFKCTPHFSMGMVCLIQAGAAGNRAAVEAAIAKTPNLAKKRFAALLAKVK